MVLKWTDEAKRDVKYFISNSRPYTENSVNFYINSLVSYASQLSTFPYLGHILCTIQNILIRQIIYKKHRIIYYIENREIHILGVIHTSKDISQFIKYLKENL